MGVGFSYERGTPVTFPGAGGALFFNENHNQNKNKNKSIKNQYPKYQNQYQKSISNSMSNPILFQIARCPVGSTISSNVVLIESFVFRQRFLFFLVREFPGSLTSTFLEGTEVLLITQPA